MKKKTFDCVEMMHQGAARVQAETAGMTEEEELKFWAQRTKALLARQRAARSKRKSA